ncbi:MAG: (5-formylfuran-3-yl)methyl phosphate synthase, partial [Planctomycetaceae bacterium]
MSKPRLLVSVRNAREANALRGSACAIVDVKEPSRGALGMADR